MESKSPTEKKIVDTALKLFNVSGIEYVGMRELAAELDMRIGNLTYYFPTKDDLVNRLTINLAEENSKTIVPLDHLTIKAFFEMLQRVFRNHVQYRCLMLSFVHIMERNPIIAKRYKHTQAKRSETWSNNIQALRKGKYITADAKEVDFLVSTISLIARFWISEAALSFKHLTEEQQLQHYTRMIARIFLPYATLRGKGDLEAMLKI